MGFFEAISTCFRKYATFQGRASRSEFWYFGLFLALLLGIAAAISPYLAGLAVIPVLLPALSVEIRRLHDTDHSGGWWWIRFVPLIGAIILLVWFVRRGTDGDNRFGSDPLSDGHTNSARMPTGNTGSASSPSSMADKTEQLAKIKVLLESGAINQEEFDRMKQEILAS